MQSLSLFHALMKRFAAARQRQRNLKVLSDLNPHMLKDIGLRWEENQIVPIFHACVEKDDEATNSVAKSNGIAEESHMVEESHAAEESRVKSESHMEKEKPVAEKAGEKILVCRYCGERLA